MLSWIIHIPIYALAIYAVYVILEELSDDMPEEIETNWYDY